MFNNGSKILLALSLVLIIVLLISANNPSQPVSKMQTSKGEDHANQENEEKNTTSTDESTTNESEEDSTLEEDKPKIECVLYDGIIENIFFHPLIAYPDKAFDNDKWTNKMDSWFITVEEFEKILNSLYEKDYVLINLNKAYTIREENGKKLFEKKPFLLPKGKKPLVISLDDLNYYDYMVDNGTVHKLIIGDNGNIAEFTQFEGEKPIISNNKSIITILENFISTHEDFSFEGARGIIALTGYNGILGYDTSKPDSPNYEEDVENATEVVDRLKDLGWIFASHGYSHSDVSKLSYDSLDLDCQKWDKYVREIIGPTNIYMYPYGSTLKTSNSKFDILLDYGFDIFMGVRSQTSLKFNNDSIYTDRVPIDGYCVKGKYGNMSRFFDVKEIIDASRSNVN